jgi:hypothetical protein
MVEKLNSALLFAGSVDDPGDDALKIVGEGWRVSHDAMRCFQRRQEQARARLSQTR